VELYISAIIAMFSYDILIRIHWLKMDIAPDRTKKDVIAQNYIALTCILLGIFALIW